MSRIKGDKTRVVTPIIDIINADTFQYSPSPLVRGGFNWGLNFKWDPIPRSELQSDADFAKPFKSPTMAGGNIFLKPRFIIFSAYIRIAFIKSEVAIASLFCQTKQPKTFILQVKTITN